ncbi:MAG: UDP-N-acetylglucosamine 1-carboxyvinyltransferase, partial [Acidobacteriota bacterium]
MNAARDDNATYIVRGGNPISGTLKPGGNKNAALPMLAATLLGGQTTSLENVPDIRDVRVMFDLLAELGATVTTRGPGRWSVDPSTVSTQTLTSSLAGDIRASFLLAGPLLGRWGRAVLPRPGGDRIGRRPLDTHLHALIELGAEVEVLPDRYLMAAPQGLRGADIFLHEMSVMGTENAIMAAALAEGKTTIHNAASEPHVQELCRLVESLGCTIRGIGTNVLEIEGQRDLGGATAVIGPDPIEVGSFIGLAAVTGGHLRITDARPQQHHRMTRIGFGRLGIQWEEAGNDIVVPAGQSLEVSEDLTGGIPKIDDGPWPAFPPDLTSIAVVLATQARGTILIHEKM